MSKPVTETFQYCPNCGVEASSIGASPFQCAACGYGFYFSPATAVGGILMNRESEMLFLVRGRDPGKGKYGLPGGFVDVGETLEESLTREVREETNLKVKQVDYLISFPNVYEHRGIEVNVLDAFFFCPLPRFEAIQVQTDEVDGFLIARPTSEILNQMAFESNRRAIEFFLQLPLY